MTSALTFIVLIGVNPSTSINSVTQIAASFGLKLSGVRQQASTSSDVILDFKSNDAVATVEIERGQTPSSLDLKKVLLENGSVGRIDQSYPSGFPLGDFCFVSAFGSLIRFGGQGVYVSARISSTGDQAVQTKYQRVLETLARVAFAESIGSEVSITPSNVISKGNAKSLSPKQVAYHSLATAVKGKSATTQVSDWKDRVRVRIGERFVDFALGSNVAMIGRNRIELSGFVVRKEGTWLLPRGALASTLGISE